MSNKKVLIWAGWYPNRFSNQGIFIKKHIELIGEFNQIRVFNIALKNHPYKWFHIEKIEEKFADVYIYFVPNFPIFKQFAFLIIPIINVLKFKKIHVFHLHVSYPYIFFVPLIRIFSKAKFILSEHWSGFTDQSGKFDSLNFFSKYFYLKSLKLFDVITVVSNYLKDLIINKTCHNNVIVIPNRIHLEINNKKTNKVKQNKLLFIGNLLDEVKNISLLINVVNEYSSKNNNIKLDIIGEGIDEEKLKKQASKLGILDKNIFFKGYIPNQQLPYIYKNYDAFILLSNYETFSIVTFEAIGNNLPVIVSDNGGIRDYVNNSNGIIVPINNLKASVNAIEMFYKNFDKYQNINLLDTINVDFYSDESIKKMFSEIYKTHQL